MVMSEYVIGWACSTKVELGLSPGPNYAQQSSMQQFQPKIRLDQIAVLISNEVAMMNALRRVSALAPRAAARSQLFVRPTFASSE